MFISGDTSVLVSAYRIFVKPKACLKPEVSYISRGMR